LQWDMAQAFQSLLQQHFKPERVAAFVAWLVHQDTMVANEMFEVGGGVVSRLAFAHQPYVQAGEDTPEAWAGLGEAVMADGELRPIPHTLAMLERELAVVCPGEKVDLSKLLEDK
jgi:hypothetical protein